MKTFAQKFKARFEELLPEHAESVNCLIPDDVDADYIDNVVFSESEYLGGMADAVLAIMKKEGEK